MSRGWTLVELLVALLLLSTGAMALAGGIAQAHRARAHAVRATLALAAAESWIETWRGRPWTGDFAQTAVVRWGAITGTVSGATSIVAPCVSEARVEASVGTDDRTTVTLVTRRFQEAASVC